MGTTRIVIQGQEILDRNPEKGRLVHAEAFGSPDAAQEERAHWEQAGHRTRTYHRAVTADGVTVPTSVLVVRKAS